MVGCEGAGAVENELKPNSSKMSLEEEPVCGFVDGADVPSASRPAHAEDAWVTGGDCVFWVRSRFSFSASAARWAMVRFALFEDPEDSDPPRRLLNASPPPRPPVLAAFCVCGGRVFCAGRRAALEPRAAAGVAAREA